MILIAVWVLGCIFIKMTHVEISKKSRHIFKFLSITLQKQCIWTPTDLTWIHTKSHYQVSWSATDCLFLNLLQYWTVQQLFCTLEHQISQLSWVWLPMGHKQHQLIQTRKHQAKWVGVFPRRVPDPRVQIKYRKCSAKF